MAHLCPLCYIIKPLSSLTTLSRARHGPKHDIFLSACYMTEVFQFPCLIETMVDIESCANVQVIIYSPEISKLSCKFCYILAGWLHTEMVYLSAIQVLTGPGVEQLR